AEEMFGDGLRCVGLAGYFFQIIASGIKAGVRIQTAEKGLSADVVPMGMCDEDCSQLWQIWSVRAQRFVSGLCGIGAGPRVYSDQLSPVVGNNEIVFGEFVTREGIHTAWHNFGNATRRKRVAGQQVFRKRRSEHNRLVESLVATPAKIVTGFGLVAIGERQFPQTKVHFP